MKNKFKLFFRERILGEQVREVDKEKSMIALFIWVAIMMVLFVFLRIGYQNNKNNTNNNQSNTNTKEVENIKEDVLKEPFSRLKDSYNYKIVVTNELGEVIESYDGIYNKGINIGNKVVNDSILNYKIENNTMINSNTNEEIEDLYGSSLSYFFTPINVYDYVNDLDYEENKDDNIIIYTYNSIYDGMSINLKITLKDDNITTINYTYNNFNYNIILS